MNARLARLRFAEQYAAMTRRNDGLPFLVNEGIRSTLRILQRAAEDGLHAIAGPHGLGLIVRVITVFNT